MNKRRDRAYFHYPICFHHVYRNNFTTKVLNQVLRKPTLHIRPTVRTWQNTDRLSNNSIIRCSFGQISISSCSFISTWAMHKITRQRCTYASRGKMRHWRINSMDILHRKVSTYQKWVAAYRKNTQLNAVEYIKSFMGILTHIVHTFQQNLAYLIAMLLEITLFLVLEM